MSTGDWRSPRACGKSSGHTSGPRIKEEEKENDKNVKYFLFYVRVSFKKFAKIADAEEIL